MKIPKFDFSGYATKSGLKCTDGRTIVKDAFKHQDGMTVPLVWQHLHNEPGNILGHAILENRDDGVYCYGVFNKTTNGQEAKELVAHGDISSLSIYATKLQEEAKKVMHGAIIEVSLVLSGANAGATIDNLSFAHSDGSEVESEDEAIIRMGIELSHDDSEKKEETVVHAEDIATGTLKVDSIVVPETKATTLEHADAKAAGDKTVKDVFDTFTDEQKNVAYYMIGAAVKEASAAQETAQHSNENTEGESEMKNNVFDKSTQVPTDSAKTLTHAQIATIVTDAKRFGSLKESFISHAVDYGFDPIDVLFPDAKDVTSNGPASITRDQTWVNDVLANTTHTPFARIRTRFADMTADEARAKGYVTGDLKKEEIIILSKRITTPTTIYKKQKLDRDDMVDITDFDVVVWLKKEMRGMLNEELARAIMISDGRNVADEDKINEQNIRPIAFDDGAVFVHRKIVTHVETTDNIIDEFIRARKFYKGSGVPVAYLGTDILTEMLLLKDDMTHRRLYNTQVELASVLRVSRIVEIEAMNTATHTLNGKINEILGIVVNLKDYTVGADKGGDIAMFDDFDIDFNQYKYLIETRCSGALTLPKSAIVMERAPAL